MELYFNEEYIKKNKSSRCKASKNLTEMWKVPSYVTSTTGTHNCLVNVNSTDGELGIFEV